MLTRSELGEFVREHLGADNFRLETHDVLNVPQDAGNVEAYLAGEPRPPHPWGEVVRQRAAEGTITRRVMVLSEPLTDYRRMSIEWQYLRNVEAGERCRIIDRPEDPGVGSQDFWLFDNVHLLLMHYAAGSGEFVGGEHVTDHGEMDRYRELARLAWDAGTDLTDWWANHPQYWRDQYVPTPRSSDDATRPTAARANDAAREGAARAT
ncbi:MAG: DUF6879 family protein [Haloechinothrix sp.]